MNIVQNLKSADLIAKGKIGKVFCSESFFFVAVNAVYLNFHTIHEQVHRKLILLQKP